jgi:hypothetical protein
MNLLSANGVESLFMILKYGGEYIIRDGSRSRAKWSPVWSY